MDQLLIKFLNKIILESLIFKKMNKFNFKKITLILVIFCVNINLLYSKNNELQVIDDSLVTCMVKITNIDYFKKDSIFFISAVNIETNKRYLIISNSKKCKCKVYKQRLKTGKIYSIGIIYLFGPNYIVSNNDLRLFIYSKPIKLPGYCFSQGIICTSPTIDSDFCIQYRHH